MNVSTRTLRCLYNRFKKPGNPFESMFKTADGFKSWVKLNVGAIDKYYDHRPAFTIAAGKLLEADFKII